MAERGKAGPKPVLLQPDRRDRLIQALSGGNFDGPACLFAGVGEATYYAALATGRQERERLEDGGTPDPESLPAQYLLLLEDVEKAKADAEVRNVALISAAAKKDWRAAAWWLERTRPHQYGRRQALEVTGKDGAPIPIGVTPVELDQALEDLLGGAPEPAGA